MTADSIRTNPGGSVGAAASPNRVPRAGLLSPHLRGESLRANNMSKEVIAVKTGTKLPVRKLEPLKPTYMPIQ